MIAWKTKGTALYQALPSDCKKSLKVCEPLKEIEENRPSQEKMFSTWNSIKNK